MTTAVAAVAIPLALVAVSVNIVVAVTLRLVEVPVTVPTPLSMERVLLFITVQLSVTWPPPVGRVGGLAENDKISGVGGAVLRSTEASPPPKLPPGPPSLPEEPAWPSPAGLDDDEHEARSKTIP